MGDYVRRAVFHYTSHDIRQRTPEFQARFDCLPPDADQSDIEIIIGPLVDELRCEVQRAIAAALGPHHDWSDDGNAYNRYMDGLLHMSERVADEEPAPPSSAVLEVQRVVEEAASAALQQRGLGLRDRLWQVGRGAVQGEPEAMEITLLVYLDGGNTDA
jgi:hypothetical protein